MIRAAPNFPKARLQMDVSEDAIVKIVRPDYPQGATGFFFGFPYGRRYATQTVKSLSEVTEIDPASARVPVTHAS